VYVYFNEGDNYETITFQDFLSEYTIDKIDFLKIDCEGGEYDIFTEINKEWILNNVKYITGEWHISGQKDGINKFRTFRDLYLSNHPDYIIFNQHTNEYLKDKVFNEDWLNEYGHNMVNNGTMIYINNQNL